MARASPVEAAVNLTLNDRLTAGLNRISRRLNRLGRSVGLDRLGKSLGGLGRSLGNLGGAAGRVTGRLSGLTAIMGLGGGGLVAAAIGVTSKVQSLGDEIGKTSRQMGLGVEALQEWRYAADRQGVSTASLETSLKAFSRRMAEAANGNKGFAKYFDQLGVSLRDADGNLRDMDSVLMDVTEAMQGIESPSERAAIAMGIFSRSGMDMTKVFEAGTDGIKGLREEAQRLGYVLSEQDTDLAEKYTDNLTNFHRRLEGLRLEIGVKLMPTMDDLVTRFGEWFDANRDLISNRIGEWVQRLTGFIEDLLDPTSEIRTSMANFAASLGGVWRAIQPVVDVLGAGKTAALALGLYIGGPLIAAVAALVPAVVKLGIVLMTTPIGWILGGLVAIGAAVYVLIKEWDSFVSYWKGLWGRVSKAFERGWLDGVVAILGEFNPIVHIARGMNAVVRYFTGIDLGEVGGRVIDRLGRGMRAAWDGVASYLRGVWGRITDAFDESWSSGISTTLQEFNPIVHIARGLDSLVEYLTGYSLSDAGERLLQTLQDGFTAKWKEIKTWALGLPEKIKGWFENIDLKQIGSDIIASLLDGMKDAWSGVAEWISARAADLTDLMPSWLTGDDAPEVKVDVLPTPGPSVSPGPSIGSGNSESSSIDRNFPIAPLGTPSQVDHMLGRVPKTPNPIVVPDPIKEKVEATTMETGKVDAAEFRADGPLLAHTPEVNSTLNVGGITIHAKTDADAESIGRVVDAKMRRAQERHDRDVKSRLND